MRNKSRAIPLAIILSASVHAGGADALPPAPATASMGAAGKTLDPDIVSPKSVVMAAGRAWIQALESGMVVSYDSRTLEKKSSAKILAPDGKTGGKPVEAAVLKGGSLLAVTSYRKNDDPGGRRDSFFAVIDTHTGRQVASLPAGKVPKMISASPDGNTLAVVNWGDNTVDLWDVSNNSPSEWTKRTSVVVGGHRYEPPVHISDRDRECGLCLRGAAFSPDSKLLAVARMGGGGISLIDPSTGIERGIWRGAPEPTRHMAVTPDGTLVMSSTKGAAVSKVKFSDLALALEKGSLQNLKPESVKMPGGVRTVALSPDGRTAWAAVNSSSSIASVDLSTMRASAPSPTKPFPVGMAVAPDGRVWVTAQGKNGQGGHAVSIHDPSR